MHTPPEQKTPQHLPLQLTYPGGQHMPFVSTYPRKQHKPLFAFTQTGVKSGPPCAQICAAAGELLTIFAAIVIWRMTDKWTVGFDSYRSSHAGKNGDEKEFHHGVGGICAVDVMGKLSVRITASYLCCIGH
jgi:hypothetical protein